MRYVQFRSYVQRTNNVKLAYGRYNSLRNKQKQIFKVSVCWAANSFSF